MSHIKKIQRDKAICLEDLVAACLGLDNVQLLLASTFVRYNGTDTCDMVIKVQGAKFEIGVVKKEDGRYDLLADLWGPGGLEAQLGQDLGLLTRAIDMEKAERVAGEHRLRCYEVESDREGWKYQRVDI